VVRNVDVSVTDGKRKYYFGLSWNNY